jgi:hypothetical protein
MTATSWSRVRSSSLRLLLLLLPSLAAAEVNLGDAAKVVSEAAAKLDLKNAKFGETLTIETVAPNGDGKQLRENLAKLKLKILYDATNLVVVEASNGARARIAFEQGGGSITLTARPANPTLPGKCVAIPDVKHPVYVNAMAINQEGETTDGRTFWDFKTERLHDVDGDGIPDTFVPVAKTKHACPEEVSYRVFVVRGTCGHDLGVIGPGNFAFDAGTTALENGFRPFVLEAQTSRHGKQGVPDMTTTTRRFAVKRGKYALADTKARTGVCHHCATWSCTAP